MDDHERQQALEEAVRDAVATHAQHAAAQRSRPASRGEAPLVAAILLGWALIGYAWLAKPAIIFGPTMAAEMSVAEREARLRYAMYLHHHDVVAFARDSGRLPNSLDELEKDAADGVRLEFDERGAWALVGVDHEMSLRLTEGMSADSFLGNSLVTLRNSK